MTTLGNTSIELGQYALGTAALGGLFTSVAEDDADDLIAAALQHGITYFDTAPQYGHGVAEQRLGRALRGVDRSSYTIATKVGRLVLDDPDEVTEWFADAPPSSLQFAFDAESTKRSLGESLERLGLDHVDVVNIHDPDDHADQAIAECYPVLHDWRDQGIVKAIGVGMNQSAIPTRFIAETDIDLVLLAGRYTLLDQSGALDLLPVALQAGVAILLGGVFNSGILADPDNHPHFDYVAPDAEVLQRVLRIRDICRSYDVELIQAALAFPQRHPAVTSILLGARSRAELEENLSLDIDAVPEALWADLEQSGCT